MRDDAFISRSAFRAGWSALTELRSSYGTCSGSVINSAQKRLRTDSVVCTALLGLLLVTWPSPHSRDFAHLREALCYYVLYMYVTIICNDILNFWSVDCEPHRRAVMTSSPHCWPWFSINVVFISSCVHKLMRIKIIMRVSRVMT